MINTNRIKLKIYKNFLINSDSHVYGQVMLYITIHAYFNGTLFIRHISGSHILCRKINHQTWLMKMFVYLRCQKNRNCAGLRVPKTGVNYVWHKRNLIGRSGLGIGNQFQHEEPIYEGDTFHIQSITMILSSNLESLS